MSLFGKDKICAVVAARDAKDMLRQLREALKYTRTVEFRLDWLKTLEERTLFLAHFKIKCPRGTFLATLRCRGAGGLYRGSVPVQLSFLYAAARVGCQWCDLELESIAEAPQELWARVRKSGRWLLSWHCFASTPDEKSLRALLRRSERGGKELGFSAVKIATQCRSLSESLRVLALAGGKRNVIAIPMGEIGLPARILALRHGSALAYAPVENATAPGQVSLVEMKNLYRADRLNRKTRVYGVIGDPVVHSLSPQMQNAGFQARKVNAVYLPFLVKDLRDFLAAIGPLGIAGFSVTLPHKEAILKHLDDCDALAAAIGAVNTVVVRGGGKLYGYNTDYVGVLRALEKKMPLRGSRVLLFGAGGAARAVAFALAQGGAAISVCARRMARADALARAAGGEAVPRSQLRREFFDAIVNATPVGMYPHDRASPLAPQELNCRLVFDLIYRPAQTRLLQLARRRGIETVSGVEMFVAQGTAQWEIWTGERAPVGVMRRRVEEALRQEAKAQGHS